MLTQPAHLSRRNKASVAGNASLRGVHEARRPPHGMEGAPEVPATLTRAVLRVASTSSESVFLPWVADRITLRWSEGDDVNLGPVSYTHLTLPTIYSV